MTFSCARTMNGIYLKIIAIKCYENGHFHICLITLKIEMYQKFGSLCSKHKISHFGEP